MNKPLSNDKKIKIEKAYLRELIYFRIQNFSFVHCYRRMHRLANLIKIPTREFFFNNYYLKKKSINAVKTTPSKFGKLESYDIHYK